MTVAVGYAWQLLLARSHDVFPLLCPKCGGETRIIAFINEAMAVREILAYLGEPISPSPMALARGPPLREMPDAAPTECDPQAQPAPDYEFDERIAWQVPRQGKPPRLRLPLVMGQLVLGVSRAANAGRPADPRQ